MSKIDFPSVEEAGKRLFEFAKAYRLASHQYALDHFGMSINNAGFVIRPIKNN